MLTNTQTELLPIVIKRQTLKPNAESLWSLTEVNKALLKLAKPPAQWRGRERDYFDRCANLHSVKISIDIIHDSPDLALQERFEIDPTSPSGLRWRTKGNGYMPGDVAGSRTAKGYWKIGKAPNKLLAHRAAYEIAYGPIPASAEIDP